MSLHRSLEALSGRTFDVLVVGGGIYGLAIAYDAAQRGLSVALIERADFGSGASFNHLRTIHGGLRYLQNLDIARARESMRERRTLATIAPHCIRPLPFVLPLDRSLARGATAMRCGFLLDRFVAFDRNHGVHASVQLPPGRVATGSDVRQFAGVPRGVDAVAVWYDYVTVEADRLTFSYALSASRHDAILANHVEALTLVAEGPRITGVRAHDRLTGRAFDIRARITVNATGGGADGLLASIGAAGNRPAMKVMNLVTTRQADDLALGGRGASGRNLFQVPWRGRALVGTWESGVPGEGPDASVTEAELARFIREVNDTFPALSLTRDEVSLVHSGVVPAVSRGGSLVLEGHERVRDHASESTRSLEGLMTVAGTKYTTARAVAERVTDRLLQKLHKPPVPCRTSITPLPGAVAGSELDAAVRAAESEGVPPDLARHLVEAYGSGYREVLALGQDQPALRVRVGSGVPVMGVELAWAARHEMALTLADAVVRRTPLGALGYPGDEAVEQAAAIVGAELAWSAERRAAEIAALRAFYKTR